MNVEYDDINLSNRVRRKHCYRLFVTIHYGYLGKGNRKMIPKCVLYGIRNQYPDPDGDYMGHKSS